MPLGIGETSKKSPPPAKPEVKGFRIPARRISSAQALAQSLRQLSFLRVCPDASDPSLVLALNVESRDISKNPYVFSILYLRADAIDVLYSQLPNISSKVRKLDMVKYSLNVLTLLTRDYEVDMKYLYQMLETVISDMNEYVSTDYQSLFSKYDNMAGDYEKVQKRIGSLENSNRELTSDNYALKNKVQELELKLSGLQKYSDSVLAVKIQNWIEEHNGEINLSEFASVHNVSEARVEQVLNNLISEGYLENRK
ncbi:MAG: hypothetical protein V1822_03470 [Candidatus Micrarchaeota archaeon]